MGVVVTERLDPATRTQFMGGNILEVFERMGDPLLSHTACPHEPMETPAPERRTDMAILTFDDARGAVQNGTAPEDAARQLTAAMTPVERLWCLDGDEPTWAGLKFLFDRGYNKAPFPAAQVERIGLPGFLFADGPRGAVIGNATCFPVPTARGATWNPELEERIGQAIGQELRAVGATLSGAVCVNLLRHPAWGRGQETYGEDPHHVGELGAAFTRGLQRHVMACVKHFAAKSMENARFSVDIEIDEIALHEVTFRTFGASSTKASPPS